MTTERSPLGRYECSGNLLYEKTFYNKNNVKKTYTAFDMYKCLQRSWNTIHVRTLSRSDKRIIVNEIQIMKKLNHKNIVKIHDFWFNRFTSDVIIITDDLSSNLRSFMKKNVLSITHIVGLCRQLLFSLQYIHKKSIIHKDISMECLYLIHPHENENTLLLGGFEYASEEIDFFNSVSPSYNRAPEIYTNQFYSEKADIYSFGIVLLELLTKKIPYEELSNIEMMNKQLFNN